jgi:hypothetical protein
MTGSLAEAKEKPKGLAVLGFVYVTDSVADKIVGLVKKVVSL